MLPAKPSCTSLLRSQAPSVKHELPAAVGFGSHNMYKGSKKVRKVFEQGSKRHMHACSMPAFLPARACAHPHMCARTPTRLPTCPPAHAPAHLPTCRRWKHEDERKGQHEFCLYTTSNAFYFFLPRYTGTTPTIQENFKTQRALRPPHYFTTYVGARATHCDSNQPTPASAGLHRARHHATHCDSGQPTPASAEPHRAVA